MADLRLMNEIETFLTREFAYCSPNLQQENNRRANIPSDSPVVQQVPGFLRILFVFRVVKLEGSSTELPFIFLEIKRVIQ